MTENFCYNQIGINHILKQFGDAISNKQYKNPIPYDTYRKIRNGFKTIFISFDCGDILVKAESTTLFHTSYKDNGFGQFFYDNYVSTTKTVETKTNIKENNLYDNDNDIGKKELMDEIREWNGDLAYRKAIQRNFWVGIYYPNIYDNLEFIPLP